VDARYRLAPRSHFLKKKNKKEEEEEANYNLVLYF
jgi:hypothetical protein